MSYQRNKTDEQLEAEIAEWEAAIEAARDPSTGKCAPCTERKYAIKITTNRAILDQRRQKD